tara:strand:+ start:2580 stop:3608 length:1029 start_codon:yes stop_codon:yes gene_type:complete
VAISSNQIYQPQNKKMKQIKNLFQTSKKLKKKKTIFFLASFFSTVIISSEKAFADSLEAACDTISGYPYDSLTKSDDNIQRLNSGNGCTLSPGGYIVKAFELGICPASINPYKETGLDTTGCEIIWKSDTGEEANLVTNAGSPVTYNLAEEGLERPAAGTYKYGYIIIDDTIRLKATLKLNNQTWHTTSRFLEFSESVPDEGPQASLGKTSGEAEFVDTRIGFFENSSAQNGVACHVENFDTGETLFSGLVLNSDKKTKSTITASTNNRGGNTAYCAGSRYLAGIQTFETPIVITNSSSSFNISFDTTNKGAWVESYQYSSLDPQHRPYFDVGPFVIRMTVN